MDTKRNPDHLLTREAAELLRVRGRTIRKAVDEAGAYLGLKPVRLPNGRLLWRRDEVLALLEPRHD